MAALVASITVHIIACVICRLAAIFALVKQFQIAS